MSYMDILQAQLEVDEGKRNKMYLDSRGIQTIGIGHNLRDNPISDRAVRVIFEDDVADAEADTRKLFTNFNDLTDTRKAVLINMMFNMGYNTLSEFHHLIEAVKIGDWIGAGAAMTNSVWAHQVGIRADRLEDLMRDG